jgi:hypothetical protein
MGARSCRKAEKSAVIFFRKKVVHTFSMTGRIIDSFSTTRHTLLRDLGSETAVVRQPCTNIAQDS